MNKNENGKKASTVKSYLYLLRVTSERLESSLKTCFYSNKAIMTMEFFSSVLFFSYKICKVPNKQRLCQLLQQKQRNSFSHSISASIMLDLGRLCLSKIDLLMWNLLFFTGKLFSNSNLIRVTYASFCPSRVTLCLP